MLAIVVSVWRARAHDRTAFAANFRTICVIERRSSPNMKSGKNWLNLLAAKSERLAAYEVKYSVDWDSSKWIYLFTQYAIYHCEMANWMNCIHSQPANRAFQFGTSPHRVALKSGKYYIPASNIADFLFFFFISTKSAIWRLIYFYQNPYGPRNTNR